MEAARACQLEVSQVLACCKAEACRFNRKLGRLPAAAGPTLRTRAPKTALALNHAAAPSLRCEGALEGDAVVDCDAMVEGDGGHLLKELHHCGQAHEQLRDHLDLAMKDYTMDESMGVVNRPGGVQTRLPPFNRPARAVSASKFTSNPPLLVVYRPFFLTDCLWLQPGLQLDCAGAARHAHDAVLAAG